MKVWCARLGLVCLFTYGVPVLVWCDRLRKKSSPGSRTECVKQNQCQKKNTRELD